MRVVCIIWLDITESRNIDRKKQEDFPLLKFVSFGVLVGYFNDKEHFPYIRVCFKKCISEPSGENDDVIDIPTGCIKEIYDLGDDKF